MRTLEGGCSVPISVETEWVGESQDLLLKMMAIVVSLDGTQSLEDAIEAVVKTDDEATALGHELSAELVKKGAYSILRDINIDRPAKN